MKTKKRSLRDKKLGALLKSNITKKNIISYCAEIAPQSQSFEKDFEKQFGLKRLLSKRNNVQKHIIHDFKKLSVPSKYSPQSDFYNFINQEWLTNTKLSQEQRYIVQIDNFRISQDKVFNQLIEIVEDYTKKNKDKFATSLKNFYHSQVRMNTDSESKDYCKKWVDNVDTLRKDKKNLWKLLALVNKNEIISWGAPFSWSIIPDEKQPTVFRSSINSCQFSIIDISVYFDDGTNVKYKREYKKEFFKYLNILFKTTLGENHGFHVEDIFDIEVKILNALICPFIKETNPTNYNKVTSQDAVNIYGFDWPEFSKELGFSKPPPFFTTANLNYLKCGSDLLKAEWDTPAWRTYWIYIYIRQCKRWSTSGLTNYYQFNAKFARGQLAQVKNYAIPSLGFAFNTFLTNQYIEQYADPFKINFVKGLAEDMKEAFIRIIKKNTWMQSQTKKNALKKLYKFKYMIGSPLVLREDPLLDYSPTDAWGNMLLGVEWRHQQSILLEGHTVVDAPIIDWSYPPPKFISTQAYVVNACYTPTLNGIYIPIAYIQEPFVDLSKRGIAYNLAHIGFTLGHEMSHSLDNTGSKYDENGVLKDWWTPKDKAHFKKIQNEVIKQYEEFAKRDGIIYDASIGIGENLADISGINVCMTYLGDLQVHNDILLPVRDLVIKEFFVYYAEQARQKLSSKRALNAQLKTNPHPLDKYRTNIPLSRIPMYDAVYNVKPGDPMYWPNKNRVWEG